jgi:hypothetical protein
VIQKCSESRCRFPIVGRHSLKYGFHKVILVSVGLNSFSCDSFVTDDERRAFCPEQTCEHNERGIDAAGMEAICVPSGVSHDEGLDFDCLQNTVGYISYGLDRT